MKKLFSIALALALVLSLSVTAFASGGSSTWATGAKAEGVTAWDGMAPVAQDITIPADFEDKFDADTVTANYFVVLTWDVESTLKYTIESSNFSWVVYDSADKDSQSADFNGTAAKAGYEGDGTWSGSATVKVTMQNWSNRPIKGSFTYTDMTAAASEAISGSVERDINTGADGVRTMGSDITLASAAEGVSIYDPADANNHVDAADVIAVTIDAGAVGAPKGMTGAISAANTVIGTLTVTISDNSAGTSQP